MRPSIPLNRRIERAVSRFFMNRSPELQRALAGGRRVVRDGQTLHPEMQLFLWAGRQRPSAFTLRAPSVAQARKRMRAATALYDEPRIEVGSTRDLTVAGADGPLRARHYAPPSARPGEPLLVFFHGGGFVLGDLDTHDAPCRLLCREAGMHVLSVEYRLAPEHPFPAGVEDAIASFRWAQRNAGELGADPGTVLVGGDSAGGNLAAVVAQQCARVDPPRLQLLIYPTTDRSSRHPSFEALSSGFYLELADMEWFDGMYLGADCDLPRTDPRLSPLCAQDLAGICPALIATAGFDPLRDEGEAYAARLQSAGVQVTLRRESGLIHGFINMIGAGRVARSTLTEIARAARAMLPEPAGAAAAADRRAG